MDHSASYKQPAGKNNNRQRSTGDANRSFLTAQAILLIFLLSCLLLPASLLIDGCGQRWKRGELCLGVLFRAKFNNYFEVMETGIVDTASKRGIRTIILQNNQMEGRKHEDLFKELLHSNIRALLICTEDEDQAKVKCLPLILKANEQKIPVLFIHSGIQEKFLKEKNAHVECLISCDNVKGGALAADYIGKRLSGRGNVLMLEGGQESYGGKKRREGFIDAIKKYPAIKTIEAHELDWQREMAFDVSREMFKKHKDINAVFAFCDLMALGASDAANISGLSKLVIVGFDGTELGKTAIKDGRIAATVNQSPYEIGKTGVLSALKALDGEKLPYYLYTKTELISEESYRLPFK
jgi:ribose transport system substrate-binding protein